jgi:hypothetical protein
LSFGSVSRVTTRREASRGAARDAAGKDELELVGAPERELLKQHPLEQLAA